MDNSSPPPAPAHADDCKYWTGLDGHGRDLPCTCGFDDKHKKPTHAGEPTDRAIGPSEFFHTAQLAERKAKEDTQQLIDALYGITTQYPLCDAERKAIETACIKLGS